MLESTRPQSHVEGPSAGPSDRTVTQVGVAGEAEGQRPGAQPPVRRPDDARTVTVAPSPEPGRGRHRACGDYWFDEHEKRTDTAAPGAFR
ncbi:hypothetical protein AQ490_15795 [Wenjunlia vitaminophila]|uniref:Uncharacterized protein n=1 Tax=Wenjunlia vitaminophila TaxID=76728 RepID=A0A0T6LWK1_WENVI|nr:hypothetical protein [Wenjunlia vitaminophila]KRV50535.1 hypothetical protein AQ490_15795 [Wenjunlia vitaminophila]